MSQRLHVLFMPSWYPSPAVPVNGIFNRDQAQALGKAGVQVGVVYPELSYWRTLSLKAIRAGRRRTGFYDEQSILTYRIHRWFMYRVQRRIQVQAMITAAHRYIARAGRPDIFHVHTANFAGFAALALSREYGVSYLITEHETSYFEKIYSDDFLTKIQPVFAQAAAVISVSKAAGKVLIDLGLVKDDQLTVIPNLVDVDFFTPPDLPGLSSPAAPFRFLSIGALEARKRVDMTLRAFAQAFPEDNTVHLEIGGDGPERARLEALTNELDLTQQVTFLGVLNREQVRDAMRRAHVFVHASLFETFGVVLIEALAAGIPVISTACGGPEDIVSSQVGRLVPVDDPAALAEALRELRLSYDRYNHAAIREFAVRRFAASTVSAQIIDLYRLILTRSRPANSDG